MPCAEGPCTQFPFLPLHGEICKDFFFLICNDFGTKGPDFPLALGPADYVASSTERAGGLRAYILHYVLILSVTGTL